MWQFLEKSFLVLLSLALCVFIFFVIEEAILYTSKDYQYALIGALGSLIGGSLTLAGVWWTLRNQAKTDFVNEFPKRIRSLEEIIADLKSASNRRFIFNESIPGNRSGVYQQTLTKMKGLATDVDGTCYFIIGKLDHLYDDYLSERSGVIKIDPELCDEMGRPVPTKEMIDLEDKYQNIMDEIISELEEYSKLVCQFKPKAKKNFYRISWANSIFVG